ncbi:MAG: hypothetical protein A2284_06985 [Deltaproteobacteria bacterium RIFOXYA12_FULL_61_11]|nr:MAG: hypothetical protein A2284_06985 [Deltaproteobacteria bacterium RIFOXYA12_FULL_61_11]
MKVKTLGTLDLGTDQQVVVLLSSQGDPPPTGNKAFDQHLASLLGGLRLKDRSLVRNELFLDGHHLRIRIGRYPNLDKPAPFWEIGAAVAANPGLIAPLPLSLFFAAGGEPLDEPRLQAFLEGLRLGAYRFERYRTKGKDEPSAHGLPPEVRVLGADRTMLKQADRRATAIVEAVNWARDLVNDCAGSIDPATLTAAVQHRFEGGKVEVRVLNKPVLEKLGMGGVLAVGRSGAVEPRVLELRYTPAKAKHHLGLIGKGVTFDAGGFCLKKYPGIETMKEDMAGAAAVLATFAATAELGLPVRLTGLVGFVENLIGPQAYKPGDVITLLDRSTVEVVNTDAEGRLVLADLLHHLLADPKNRPDEVIDVATLTGNCITALGPQLSGLLTNDQALAKRFLDSVKKTSHERFWQMPLFKPYREQLKSPIADRRNIGNPVAGCITAALFLADFVPEGVPWLHLDIAGTAVSDGYAPHLPKGATGVPTKSLIEYLSSRCPAGRHPRG